MSTLLLSVPVRGKRDILLARQRARQLAGLLGYDSATRIGIAAAAFAVADAALQRRGRCTIAFQIEEGSLQIVADDTRPQTDTGAPTKVRPAKLHPRGVHRLLKCVLQLPAARPQSELRFDMALPATSPMSAEDAAWAVRELDRHTPLEVFAEMRQQNEELLRLAHELGVCPAPSARQPERGGRSAA